MDKRVYMVAVLALLVVALASVGVYARRDMAGQDQSLSCNRTDLVGAIVKNARGRVIGTVNSVEDDGGQSFAIINHGPDSYYGEGGGYTPVPVGALRPARPGRMQFDHLKTVVLHKTEEQLEAAPFWDPTKMTDPQYEAKIDKFFGAQPSVCS